MQNSNVELQGKTSTGSSMAKNATLKFKKISVRLESLRRSGPPPLGDRTDSPAARALKGLKFLSETDTATWATVEEKFDEITSQTANGLLPFKRLWECIALDKDKKSKESREFADLLCKAVARQRNVDPKSEYLSKHQFKEFWDLIVHPGFDSRLKTFFHMVDRDADGKITVDELREMISLSASANKLSKIQNRADEFARLFMEELDRKHQGYISIENLEMVLLQIGKSPSLEMSRKLSKLRSGKQKPMKEHVVMRWCQSFDYFVLDNWRRIWVMAAWIGAMAAVFAYKYVEYMKKPAAFEVMGHCLCVAKGAAETLKLNMALILFPMCRNTITWLRNDTRLGLLVPFDDNINFHQIIAVAIAIGSATHTIVHLTCDFPRLLHASKEKFKPLEPFFKQQPRSYWHFVKGCESITGTAMVVLMAVTFVLACPCFRRNNPKLPRPLKKFTGYNAFWYSHHLHIIVYILLIVHGFKLYLNQKWYKKTTWMYLAIPILLYAGERLIRSFRSRVNTVEIRDVNMYPGDVLALTIWKPEGFRYKSGQYIFVKCDAVSPLEWHPFSITSAPRDDYISVHIRIRGDWTAHLKALIFPELSSGKSEFHSDKNHKLQGQLMSYPKIKIDGPYGAPTQDYKEYEVVLLVGLGIGATPMISVAKDIITNIHETEKEEEEAVEEGRIGESKKEKHKLKTKKAYFYWVTREEGSFEWFNDVMNEVYSELIDDHNDVIEMHNHCSSVYEKRDARCALILMLQSIHSAMTGEDLISGSRIKTHFAKPIWKNVFESIAYNHPNSTVGVFYCGAPELAKTLGRLAHEFSHKRDTKFEFHKENF